MTVRKIENLADYEALLAESKGKLLVIDFSAEW